MKNNNKKHEIQKDSKHLAGNMKAILVHMIYRLLESASVINQSQLTFFYKYQPVGLNFFRKRSSYPSLSWRSTFR